MSFALNSISMVSGRVGMALTAVSSIRNRSARVARPLPRASALALAIAERLAEADPGNAEWQRDLIVSCVKLGDAEPEAARTWLARALPVARALRAAGRLAPVDAWMPAELEHRLRNACDAPD